MLRKITIAAAGLAVAATAVLAASHAGPFDAAIGARQAHMKLYGFNIGVLGAMAQGKMDYDAEAASKAAGNLALLTKVDQSAYWLPGSDSDANANTRALPALWQNFPDVIEKVQAVAAAADAMNAAAGQGLEALQGAIGPLGGACGACHKAYRKPQ